MADFKVVIHRTFGGRRVARDGIHILHVAQESRCSSRENLVRVALMAHVEHELVLWGVEHIVQCHGGFHESQVGSNMPAVLAHTVEYGFARLFGNGSESLHVQSLQVGW